MYHQDASFLQTQVEQILAHHGQLEAFEHSRYLHLCLRPENSGPFNIIRKGNSVTIIFNRDPSVICDANPNITFDIFSNGYWCIREMTNSYFVDESESENSFELWDTLIRFDNFDDAVVYAVSSKKKELHPQH